MATRIDNPEGSTNFYEDLNDMEIRLPGNIREAFSSDKTWLEMAEKQYPKWRARG